MLFTPLISMAIAWQQAGDVPLFRGTGSYSRPASKDPLAQKYFDQGLNMLYAFHHGEAKRSFRKALQLDANAPMIWWGLATSNGPHVNMMEVPPEDEREAFKAISKASELKSSCGPAERALISAASKRFAWPQPADRSHLNRAYADAMRQVWHRFPNDPDVGALFAESMMDLRPWDLWKKNGQPQPGTHEIVRTLQSVLKVRPDHPLGLHLYIHAVEASPTPELAKAAADRLRDLQPGLGHNVHMPSHLDVRIGQWEKAVIANRKAMSVDKNYRSEHTPAPIYRVYMAHNNHMLSFAAIMLGESKLAIQALDDMVAAIPNDFKNEMAPFVDGFLAMPIEARVRFGRWDEVLEMPDLGDSFPLARALRHAARAVAFAAKGDPANARVEQSLFYAARSKVSVDSVFGNNRAHDVLLVATHLMNGEILVSEGRTKEAISALRLGVDAEDALRYSEPPDWIQPVRHTLGALLLREKRFSEARDVYSADLRILPRNGWSLYGMAASLNGLGQTKEAEKYRKLFAQTWRSADVQITSSCLCIPGR